MSFTAISMSQATEKEPKGHAIDCDEPRSDEEEPTTSDNEFLASEGEDSDAMDHFEATRRLFAEEDEEEPPTRGRAKQRSKAKRKRAVISESPGSQRSQPVVVPPVDDDVVVPKASAPSKQGVLSKHWTVTFNNYPVAWDLYTEDQFKERVAQHFADHFASKGHILSYVCAGKEVAPTTGTRHLQMYLVFAEKRRKTALVKAYPQLSYIPSSGTPKENDDYCSGECDKKGNVRNPFFSSFGSLPLTGGQGCKAKWTTMLTLARKGDFEGLMQEDPRFFVTQVKNLEYIARKYGSNASVFENKHEHRGIWIYSTASGVGKTSAVRRQWPNLYMKAHDQQWNDYNNEEVALLDDFSKQDAHSLGHLFKFWCDHQRFQGRILYGTCQVHLKWFVVTSNWSIQDLFGDMGPEILGPILNRFRVFNWNDGVKWQDRPLDVFSEENLNNIPLNIL